MLSYLDPTALSVVLAAGASLIAVLGALTSAIYYGIERSRLPQAVRWSELDSVLGAKEERLRYLDDEIKQREATLAERDQVEAEAEHWRSVLETVKAEYAALDEQRREIETVREEYRQAAEDLSVQENELRRVRGELNQTNADLEKAQAEIAEIDVRREDLDRLAAEEKEKETLLAHLHEQLEAIRDEKALQDTELLGVRETTERLRREGDDLEREAHRLTEQRDEARKQLEAAKKMLQEVEPRLAEVEELESQRNKLDDDITRKEDESQRLNARLARLREETGAAADTPKEDDERVLRDLRTVPACFAKMEQDGEPEPIWPLEQSLETEEQALARVSRLLEEMGLRFPRRTLYAFHTSLKTAVISPLTVLAGISGTGKSQLPRRYAEAMGLHFLKIPVQPRWDSPQDLLGFYNYIERRYKATDLARALVHLDSHNWPEEAEPYADRMLLVLLDEMNLARVEYYFSEFLSRLEGRPREADAGKERARAQAEIDIDVSRSGQPRRVYAGQNVLFVGTMNEDESTLALSDKVLDRANVLRFPRPVGLRNTKQPEEPKQMAQGYLPKARWIERWTQDAERLSPSLREQTETTIEKINEIMDDFGRPFGFRMSQSMLHYVANYPKASHQAGSLLQMQHGLADQIEQRIMPKLRGIDVNDYGAPLRNLADLAGARLNDQQLGEAINQASQDSAALGMFNWRGFTRTE